MMEADSTTYDCNAKTEVTEPTLPFNTSPDNLQLYKELTTSHGDLRLECQLVERLQAFGLLPKAIKCPSDKPGCKVVCRTARVIDRVQWICEGCSKRLPIRAGSFFFRLQCSILQTVQMIFAWSEDADVEVAAAHFGVKPRVATLIYDRLDELAIKEQSKKKLGGENSVVLAEMYPDCVNRLSPDTTDQPHVHRILMLADTNHIPTSYWLHVMKNDNKKTANGNPDTQALTLEVEEVIRKVVISNSLVVTGTNVPPIEGASSIQQLLTHCDADMQHFLSSRIWRQAITLSLASRSVCCDGLAAASCGAAAQRYLTAALDRVTQHRDFYSHVLQAIAEEYTDKCD
ncbi:uncharacterized protein LOC124631274 [Helicoverpa zea]|uniref:uncharacterized protein LOC124631274 n=1 Tax=Helicoverpa zea TaxID=7113 RepID=UPI001F59AF5C|nr:uncharacterized protein LOC124631274 [Helicoverpa zea]XP_047021543.1 uncharacterized protein LOC124631274 [Helicoverpa zea]